VGARRISEFARQLRDTGWSVTVIAAEGEDIVQELDQDLQEIEIIRIRPPQKLYRRIAQLRQRNGSAGSIAEQGGEGVKEKPVSPTPQRETLRARLKRYYHSAEWTMDDRKLFSLIMLLRALMLNRKWDWVISSGPPMSVHVAARMFSTLVRTRWVMDLRDPWVGSGHWNRFVQTPLRDKMERFFEATCVGHANLVTTTSPGIAAALTRRFPRSAEKIHVVYNGFDGQVEKAPRKGAGRLRLLYAGSLYYNRDPFPLLDAIGALVADPSVDRKKVSFTLVGNCRHWKGIDVAARAKALGVSDCVHILPAVSPGKVREMIRESEILVNFAQGQPDQIPAKLYEHMASGREMLLIAEKDSDSARVAVATGQGRVVEPNDSVGLREVMRDLYSFYVQHSRPFKPFAETVTEFSRESQNRRFLQLLSVGGATHES
jgi:glycosyltransferase involved in cell wall biosynthesis